jgi:hypothetical protein
MPRHAAVQALPPDEPPEETSTDIARSILASIAEDPYMRSSYRLRAREHLRQLRKADQRDLRADAHRPSADDDEAEEDEF